MTPWEALHERQWAERRAFLAGALAECEGNRTVAAERLGIQRTYFARLIKAYGVNAERGITGVKGNRQAKRLRAHFVMRVATNGSAS